MIQQNALFGILKSAVTYLFLLVYYRVADPAWIALYIQYEIALAATILATGGLQSYSYKELDPRGLHVLALAGLMLWLPAAAAGLALPASPFWIVVQLALADRLSDLQLQATRQDARFLRYNLLDLGSQTLSKSAFLLAALGHPIWLPVLALKATASTGWLLLRRRAWQGEDFLPRLCNLFRDRAEWMHYVGFDALNYGSSQLDLVLLTTFAPPPILAAYFYARKFVRLPLVLLNYVLDPAYVAIRGMSEFSRQRRATLRLLAWSTLGMIAYAFLLVPVLAWTSGDAQVVRIGACLFTTAHFTVLLRFGDLVTLLHWPQKWRTLSRLAGTLANASPVLLASAGLGWHLGLALIPLLAWVTTLGCIFRRLDLKQMLAVLLSLAVLTGVVRTFQGSVHLGHWLGGTDWIVLAAALPLVLITALGGSRAFHWILADNGERPLGHS